MENKLHILIGNRLTSDPLKSKMTWHKKAGGKLTLDIHIEFIESESGKAKIHDELKEEEKIAFKENKKISGYALFSVDQEIIVDSSQFHVLSIPNKNKALQFNFSIDGEGVKTQSPF